MDLKERYIRLKTNIENIESEYTKKHQKTIQLKEKIGLYQEARDIISAAMKEVQSSFKSTIEDPINDVISYVYYKRNFKFVIDVKEKSSGYEWEPKILDNDKEVFNIKEDSGGLVSVIGFVFKIIFHVISNKNLRNTLCFDEPVSNIGDLTGRFGEIIEMLSHKFGIQFIISTHNKDLKSLNGKRFEVEMNGEYSTIQEF